MGIVTRWAAVAGLASFTSLAGAQSSITIYGSLDQYLNYLHSSSGATIKSLQDGAILRSRLGVRGTEDLGDGLSAKFALEQGLFLDTGTAADTTRAWDRQAWVGLASVKYGEFRIGRQNTAIFYRGDYIDFTTRTLGSVVNAFGVPSRYSNDFSYISPRWAGVYFELHYALGETTGGVKEQAVYQAAIEYLNGPFRVGYAGLRGRPPSGAPESKDVRYDNVYLDYQYGKGTLYATYVRSNNTTSTGTGASLVQNGGTILSNVGGVVAGTNPDVNRMYDIYQLSADYSVSAELLVGALVGKIHDTSGAGHSATGAAIAAYYSFSKRTMLYAIAEGINNDDNAGFRPAGSAGLSPNFATANDVNGRVISGVHVGIRHRF